MVGVEHHQLIAALLLKWTMHDCTHSTNTHFLLQLKRGHLGTGRNAPELPVQEWMLQWYVIGWCAQMHPTQWQCLYPLNLHGCMSKLGVFRVQEHHYKRRLSPAAWSVWRQALH
jgi:hypothetical protein